MMIELGRDWEWSPTSDLSLNRPLSMRWIEPGSFMMGSPIDERGRNPDERQFRANLTKGFWMASYLITQGHYVPLMGSNFCSDLDRPVESVSWDDSTAFCDRLNATLEEKIPIGYRFSLPSECQWEYCCRAGTTSTYLCGESDKCLDDFAWHGGNSNGETKPVGLKLPNAWGVYDMQGNVMEWCVDGYMPYPLEDTNDWVGDSSKIGVVYRSASYGASDFRMFRSAHRGYTSRNMQRAWIGFRVVLASV
jgi:formylglycine-generating enzyme required for sulfatase activity